MGAGILKHINSSWNTIPARNVLIELKVPKGDNAGYVDPISYFPGQLEL
ncbi:ADP-ribosyltransferase [Paenibacillus larvae]|nr:ADP-ribosyltransferase [Paenibacillus larvae]MDV3445665.1 ADP-ribosyltransferase [Paenibacillus larvae]